MPNTAAALGVRWRVGFPVRTSVAEPDYPAAVPHGAVSTRSCGERQRQLCHTLTESGVHAEGPIGHRTWKAELKVTEGSESCS